MPKPVLILTCQILPRIKLKVLPPAARGWDICMISVLLYAKIPDLLLMPGFHLKGIILLSRLTARALQ